MMTDQERADFWFAMSTKKAHYGNKKRRKAKAGSRQRFRCLCCEYIDNREKLMLKYHAEEMRYS